MAEPARFALATAAGIGQYPAQAFEKLGIAAELKPKTRLGKRDAAPAGRQGRGAW
jgi:hypothetical protein